MKLILFFSSVVLLFSCGTLFKKSTVDKPLNDNTSKNSVLTDMLAEVNVIDSNEVSNNIDTSSIVNQLPTVAFDTLDELNLDVFALKFEANQLNLTNSIIQNTELNNFLKNQDKKNIKSNVNFEYFISMIILKQYEFHITKYHQGFDLFTMRAGNAGFIVSSFVEICNLPEGTKGVNSSYIIDYISTNEKLKNEPNISIILNRISNLPK